MHRHETFLTWAELKSPKKMQDSAHYALKGLVQVPPRQSSCQLALRLAYSQPFSGLARLEQRTVQCTIPNSLCAIPHRTKDY